MYIDPIQIRIDSNELNHHGILGMKWGVRRYQNKDGSLTEDGKKRYHKKLNADINRASYSIDPAKVREAYREASYKTDKEYKKLNKKHKKIDFDDLSKAKENYEYLKELKDIWKKTYKEALSNRFPEYVKEFGTDWMEQAPMMKLYSDELDYWKNAVEDLVKR